MKKCPNCNAPVDDNQKVCEYCGAVLDKIDNELLNELRKNLVLLEELKKPSIFLGIIAGLRIWLIILSCGIVYIFWNKYRVDKNNTTLKKRELEMKMKINKMKSEVKGNLSLENELYQIEKKMEEIVVQYNLNKKMYHISFIISLIVFLGFNFLAIMLTQ